MLQRRSRRSLALKQTSRGDLSPEAARSARRLSLDKAQSRQGSQKVLDSAQTLENNGIAADHQKPSGTTMNPLADVETGQMANGNVGAAKTAPSNAGTYTVLWHSMSPITMARCTPEIAFQACQQSEHIEAVKSSCPCLRAQGDVLVVLLQRTNCKELRL